MPALPPANHANSNVASPLETFHIQDVFPAVDGGRFPVKRVAGAPVDIWADIYRDGHDVISARLIWRCENGPDWVSEPMSHHSNDRWTGTFTPSKPGRYIYAIEAWTDEFATWRRAALLKRDAGQDIAMDALEGAAMLTKSQPSNGAIARILTSACETFIKSGDPAPLFDEAIAKAMAQSQTTPDVTRSDTFPLTIDRERAVAGAWYEMIPRSQGTVPGRHGTFRDCIARLPDIAEMGFDVLYFTPIHPIGTTNRKGRNNSLKSQAQDPGSPYAIGGAEGGHDAIHPELGTFEDFHALIAAAHAADMEVALDFAVQCSPDHPWVKQHPNWFKRRPDGTIRYAENPPKKYEDIHNPDFHGDDALELWDALRDVVLFWVSHGVRIFRVDNPHTKPLPFWEWLIKEVQTQNPDVIFLAEAFTRPKVMKGLAKLGFTQSYTYFTWRVHKGEIEQYLRELTGYPERDYYRPNFFVNTPDILPFHLQSGEAWMFKSRVALAATLSGSYGIYNGFELLEHEPIPGKEEYINSEKYEIKVRDWDKPGNIKGYIRDLNKARRANDALLQTSALQFLPIDNDQVIGFFKWNADRSNVVVTAISLSRDPHEVWIPLGDVKVLTAGMEKNVAALENILTGERHGIEWGGVRLRIDPQRDPALLFRCLA